MIEPKLTLYSIRLTTLLNVLDLMWQLYKINGCQNIIILKILLFLYLIYKSRLIKALNFNNVVKEFHFLLYTFWQKGTWYTKYENNILHTRILMEKITFEQLRCNNFYNNL